MMTKRPYIRWSKQLIIDEINNVYASGFYPSVVNMRKLYGNRIIVAGIKLFGKWDVALNESGINYNKIKRWTNIKIINEIRRLYELGEDLSPNNISRKYILLYRAALYYLGPWFVAVGLSGVSEEDYNRMIDHFKNCVITKYA